MNTHLLKPKTFSILLLLVSSAAYGGADVLQNVPQDALGFVVVKNLSATDGKIAQLFKTLGVEFPAPLAFLQATAGALEGIDPQGDFLLTVLPDAETTGRQSQFCVWLPVRDYARFVAALDSASREGIAAVTVAGEDLLVARHGEWALVMDPDQRERMEQLLAAEPNPPAAVIAWKNWIDANDVVAVALPNGVRAILSWAAATPAAQSEPDENADDLFGPAAEDEKQLAADAAAPDSSLAKVRTAIRDWITRSPKLADWMLGAKAVGFALQIDENANALAGVRMSCSDKQLEAGRDNADPALPPTLYRSGNFVLYAGGTVSPALSSAAAESYVRYVVEELKNEHRLVLDQKSVALFQKASENALAEVTSVAVLTHPGDKSEGLYTNDFLLVRATSAELFVDRASEMMRLWNKMNRDAEGDFPLIFDVEEQMIGDRRVIQYPTEVMGAADLAVPEVRKVMEQFFGPGGKLRLWIAPVDDHAVLLAAGTEREVAAALELLDQKQPITWDHSELGATNTLLPEQSSWRLFVSPSEYHRWQRQLSDAMTGPVFGGRPSKEFPPSPPLGVAAGMRDDELWIDAAVPAETIQSTGAYLKK
jgi:hypothetical protein